MNKFEWTLNHNIFIFFQENEFWNVACKMKAILSRSHCVKQHEISYNTSTKILKDRWDTELTTATRNMMTSSNGSIFALLALCEGNPPVIGGFPSQKPVTRSFDVFFDLRLNKRLSKQSGRRWFQTSSRSLWRHYDELGLICTLMVDFCKYVDVAW